MTDSTTLAYYREHSLITDPRDHGWRFDDLPQDLPSMARVIQGVMIHPAATRLYDLQPVPEAPDDRIRLVSDMLTAILEIDDAPLTVARPPSRRLVASCRNAAVLLVAMLRHQGVPARARWGFARYLPGPHNYIHAIAEYWHHDHRRWVLVDPGNDERIAEGQRAFFASSGDPERARYDTFDIQPGEFILGGEAWRACRIGEASADQFGEHDDRGLHWPRVTVLQELNVLNKAEVIGWDSWGGPLSDDVPLEQGETVRHISREQFTAGELAFLDKAAEVTLEVDQRFDELRSFYETSSWGRPVFERLREFDQEARRRSNSRLDTDA